MGKKNTDGYVLKSEVLLIIQNYIRGIQMDDHRTDSGIPQLSGRITVLRGRKKSSKRISALKEQEQDRKNESI